MLDFRILGPLEVVGDAGQVRLGGPKQRATLAILLLSANRVVSVDRLADDLYAGAPPVTAVTQVQRQVSELRKALGGASVIETRPPGYAIRIPHEGLDLHRFERLTEEAAQASAGGQPELASSVLTQALGLWRGAPLADLAYESFARTSIDRLEEIRMAALERRIEADLALGRHRDLVGELESLVWDHPLRERLRAQLMLALYRSGRQAEALDVYRRTRDALVEEFGIEPGRALQELERAILTQDPSLDTDEGKLAVPRPDAESKRVVLVVPSDARSLDGMLAVAERLARLPARELIMARLLTDETQLEEAAASLRAQRASLGTAVRSTAFTSHEPARDVVRLATTYDAELLLVDSPSALDGDRLPDVLASILEHSPADVGVLTRAADSLEKGAGVFVPFGGSPHDWAALELGAWLTLGANIPLRLLGTATDPRARDRRDASRLLADASIAVQRVVGVDAAPLLAEPSEEALVAAVEPAGLVVVGISPRWRQEGIGAARRALLREARPATLLVHRGLRPSGLAPEESRTRFSWSIET